LTRRCYPSEADVLAIVVRLAAGRRRLLAHVGRGGGLELPGPTATDVGRAIACYSDVVRPVLVRLVEGGQITTQRVGPARCYLPARRSA
jgi:hypothetical protein